MKCLAGKIQPQIIHEGKWSSYVFMMWVKIALKESFSGFVECCRDRFASCKWFLVSAWKLEAEKITQKHKKVCNFISPEIIEMTMLFCSHTYHPFIEWAPVLEVKGSFLHHSVIFCDKRFCGWCGHDLQRYQSLKWILFVIQEQLIFTFYLLGFINPQVLFQWKELYCHVLLSMKETKLFQFVIKLNHSNSLINWPFLRFTQLNYVNCMVRRESHIADMAK